MSRAPVLRKASFMDDLLREFLTETGESLDTVDNQLVKFEQEPNNAKILDNIFRLVHTIKGTCGFLGLPRLEALAHAGETLMGKFRDGMPVTAEAVTLILSSIDRIKEILSGLETTEAEPEGTDQDLIVKLEELVERGIKQMSESGVSPQPAQPAVAEGTLVPQQRLSNVTAELQEGVMKTRMQPIGNAWQKLPRIVRDLSGELGKQIELEMHGADTELDRQVLDLIKDPLTHMVRNSADHGLETPAERLASGKGEQGTIRLSAYHEGGHIIICIADNGRGLNTERIKAKALQNGLVSEAELEKMTEAQIHKFIFAPGFSTAATVTSVSGRGVGMDVVRTNIDQIGGTIDIKSVAGAGSSVTIKIPLTLAIVSALIVEAAGDRFAIPQLSVVELVRARANSEHRIERIKDTAVLRLRNKLLR